MKHAILALRAVQLDIRKIMQIQIAGTVAKTHTSTLAEQGAVMAGALIMAHARMNARLNRFMRLVQKRLNAVSMLLSNHVS